MANDLLAFARRIETIGAGIPQGAARVQRAVTLAADQSVVMATPKDTGRATSNWIVTPDQPSDDQVAPYVAGAGGSTGEQNNQAAIDQAVRALAGHRPGQRLYITNNLPYIGELNEGKSPQAGAGYVEAAVNAAVGAIRSGRVRVLER